MRSTSIGPSIFASAPSAAARISLFRRRAASAARVRTSGRFEAAQDVEDQEARHGVLALQRAEQLGHSGGIDDFAD